MSNKIKIVQAMNDLFSSGSLGFNHLAGLMIKKDWISPEQGDYPNYRFVYKMCQEYIDYSKTIEKPVAEGIVYENVIRYLASLTKQDPAYYTRFNGIMFRVLHDFQRNKISSTPGANLDYLSNLVKWWDRFDGRERNHSLYLNFLNYIVDRYNQEKFYEKSIDWGLNWIGTHADEFVFADEMNPKKWYGNNGVGFMDNLTFGGMG
jgi:hypothetical protein